MSIASQRLLAYLDKITQEAMKEGDLPHPVLVQQKLNIFAREQALDLPSLKYRDQPRRGMFNLDSYNSMVEEIVEDMNFAFAEQVDQAGRLLRAINETDVRYNAFLHQIDTLDDLLEVLLLVEPKATGYFYGLMDSFLDLNLVDQAQTTAEVDLASGTVHLPTLDGTRKIPMRHLANRNSVAIITAPRHEPQFFRQELLSGSQYGFAFQDSPSNGWQQAIWSFSTDGWEGHITIPVSMKDRGILSGDPEDANQDFGGGATLAGNPTTEEIHISRVDIEGLNGTVMDIKVLHSVDGQNYQVLPGHDWTELDGRRHSIYFERLKVEFLRVLMRKHQPDGSRNPGGFGLPFFPGKEYEKPGVAFMYIVGLKNLSIYDAGYAREGEMISKELDPGITVHEGSSNPGIGRIALEVNDEVPAGTRIDYYVAPYTTGAPDWFQVQPVGRNEPGSPPFVDLSQSLLSPRRDNRELVTASPTVNSTRNGLSFYELATQMNGNQLVDSVRVYRGVGGWQWKRNNLEEVVEVRDNYVVFTQNDNFQKLYLEIVNEEVAAPATGSILTLSRPILEDESLNVVPQGAASDRIPDYSVKQVFLHRGTPTSGAGELTVLAGNNGSWDVTFTTTAWPASTPLVVGDHIYLANVGPSNVSGFYKVLSVSDLNTDGTSKSIGLEDQEHTLQTDATVSWTAEREDVTSYVQDINGRTITLRPTFTFDATDRFFVTYRSPLDANETPISSSIVVKESSTDTPIQYAPGRDYTYRGTQKGISRNPEGRIVATGESKILVRVDFQYRRLTSRLDTYTAFFNYQGRGEPIEMGASIGVDSVNGEAVLFQANQTETRDLSRVTTLDGLENGQRMLVVQSKPLVDGDGNVDTSTAIYKVINATDSDGRLLFGPRHFSEQRGFATPMRPVTLFYLQTSIGKNDRSAFGVDGNKIVLNFDPTASTDTLYMVPGTSTPLNRERFEIEYNYRLSNDEVVTSLMFKALLFREESYPTDVTPVLRQYQLRLAH